jgi:hypothetical protein
MSAEQIDEKMDEIIEQAAAPLSPQLRERALGAMAACRPARARPRLRLVAVAAFAVAALVGVGFVPFPAGSAKGAWNRALAAVERAASVHVVACGLEQGRLGGPREKLVREDWASEDGFSRMERRKDGELRSVRITDEDRVLRYDADWHRAHESYLPPLPPAAKAKSEWPIWQVLAVGAPPGFFLSMGYGIKEWRETSLWGGAVDVVEAEKAEHSPRDGKPYGWKRRWVIDPSTGLPLSVEHYTLDGDRWVQTYWTETIEWNAEVPESAREDFEPPPGTTLRRNTYWKEHADTVVATAATRDWTVTLHGIDVGRRGDISLGLSRWPAPNGAISQDQEWPDSNVSIKVEAVDDTGARYKQYKGFSYVNFRWTTRLDRERPVGPGDNPQTITLTIRPYFCPRCVEGVGFNSPAPEMIQRALRDVARLSRLSLDQLDTIRDLPLPPRQASDDPMARYQEEIQY